VLGECHRHIVEGMDAEVALKFAEEWVAGWNSHDLERILTHYADDVVFSSPHIIERLGKPSGEVHGKDELRAYWGSGLQGEGIFISPWRTSASPWTPS
jgi:hypothetical protein